MKTVNGPTGEVMAMLSDDHYSYSALSQIGKIRQLGKLLVYFAKGRATPLIRFILTSTAVAKLSVLSKPTCG